MGLFVFDFLASANETLDSVQYEPEEFIVDDDERHEYLVSMFSRIRERVFCFGFCDFVVY